MTDKQKIAEIKIIVERANKEQANTNSYSKVDDNNKASIARFYRNSHLIHGLALWEISQII